MKEIKLAFSNAEALVLFDWVARFNENEVSTADDVEQQVLFNIEAQLESVLVEPLQTDYKAAVNRAKTELRS